MTTTTPPEAGEFAGPGSVRALGRAYLQRVRSLTWTVNRLAARYPWTAFCSRRAVRLVVSLYIVITASFAMIRLIPGDPVRAALGVNASPSLIAAKKHQLGLDQPMIIQYGRYLRDLAHGDFGTSLVTNEPVGTLIREGLPNTLLIAVLAFVLVLVVAFPIGLLAAIHTRAGRHRRLELVFTGSTSILGSLPGFVLAEGLVAAFAVELPLFPVAGKSGASSYVLPVVALGLPAAAMLTRIVRIEALRVLGEDFIRTARSKRLTSRIVYVRHAAPNMVTASLTIAGNLLPSLIAGTVLVENVFAWPGLGTTIANSVVNQDYYVVQAVVLILGAIILAVNFLVDALLALLDPRSTIRES